MSNAANTSIVEVTEDLPERSLQLIDETIAWLNGNWTEVLIAVGVALFIASVLLGLRSFGHRLIRDESADLRWRSVIGRVLSKTNLFFITMCSVELVAEHANTPDGLLEIISFLFVIAVSFQAAIWARELVLGLVQQRVGDADDHSTLGSAIGIIRLLVTVALFSIAIIVILDNLGVNVTGLVAGLGIGGIAIGLAAQGIFSDLFAALSIIFDKPFRKGDAITFSGMTGTVENIGLKTTRIRAVNGEMIMVANAKLLEQQLQNWTLMHRRRVVLQFGVIYQTSPDLMEQLVKEVQAIVEAEPNATFDRLHAFQFGASSIDYELVFYVESAGYADFMTARHNVMIGMMRKFEELGVDFAYPTQMGFIAGLDGKPIDPRHIPPHLAPAP